MEFLFIYQIHIELQLPCFNEKMNLSPKANPGKSNVLYFNYIHTYRLNLQNSRTVTSLLGQLNMHINLSNAL